MEIPANLMEIYKANPVLGTILIIASMFFFTVLWRGWPDLEFLGNYFGKNDEDDEDDEPEEKTFNVRLIQKRINIGKNHLPESIEFTATIIKEDEE